MRRQWNKILLLSAALVAATVGGFLALRTTGSAAGDEPLGHSPTASNPKTAADEKAIEKNRKGYVTAFNAGNARALAAFWAEDGEFVDASGRTFRSRNAIEKDFAAFFANAKGSTLEISMESLRFVSPGVALESGDARIGHGPDSEPTSSSYSIVHIKRDGLWQLASVREAAYAPATNYEHLRDLEWLVGLWTASSAGRTVEMSCDWSEKRNFLIRKYTLKDADGTTRTGTQIIGWDPVQGGIRSWVFDSDGGFGSEQWIREGKRWVLEATAVTRDGAQTNATNFLTSIDHDNFTWQSVDRGINQIRLPDTAIIKVTRVKANK